MIPYYKDNLNPLKGGWILSFNKNFSGGNAKIFERHILGYFCTRQDAWFKEKFTKKRLSVNLKLSKLFACKLFWRVRCLLFFLSSKIKFVFICVCIIVTRVETVILKQFRFHCGLLIVTATSTNTHQLNESSKPSFSTTQQFSCLHPSQHQSYI